MANFTDLLGTLIKAGMSQSSMDRTRNTLGGQGGAGGLSDLLKQLGQMAGGSASGAGAGGGLGGMLGSVLGSLGSNRSAAGGLGALVGAILGGGGGSVKGALGGGGLAMLASLAFAALQKAGQQPPVPKALMDSATPGLGQALEDQALLLVKAMINAAKADGQIDDAEVQKIIGKLDDDGLTEEEKNFFLTEANKPMDLEGVIRSANNNPQLAAQIYAASLLAIEVDTAAEQEYMQQLAAGLGLPQEAIAYIQSTMGVQAA